MGRGTKRPKILLLSGMDLEGSNIHIFVSEVYLLHRLEDR